MTYRAHYNNQGGITGASLTSGGTTLTFGTAPGFPTIASPAYVAVTLDPGTASEEIVHITAYTAGATTATIVRNQEGSAGVSHTNGATWVHGPTALDTPDQTAADYSTFAEGQAATHGGYGTAGVNANGQGLPADAAHTHQVMTMNSILVPTGWKAETVNRGRCNVNTQTPFTSGQQNLFAILLQEGVSYTKLGWGVGGTGLASGLTHQWMGLYDLNGNALAVTVDGTSTALSASGLASYNLSATFIPIYTGYFLIGLVLVGTIGALTAVGLTQTNWLDQVAPPLAGVDATHTGLGAPGTQPAVVGSGGGGAGSLNIGAPAAGLQYLVAG